MDIDLDAIKTESDLKFLREVLEKEFALFENRVKNGLRHNHHILYQEVIDRLKQAVNHISQ